MPAVLIFSYILYNSIFSESIGRLPNLPVIHSKPSEWFPYYRAAWRNMLDLKSALEIHHTQYKEATVCVPILGSGNLVLLPSSQAQWMIDQPECVLSMHQQTEQHFQVEHGTVYRTPDQAHIHLVATKLTSQIGNLVPDLVDELDSALRESWSRGRGPVSDGDERGWKEVCVYDTLRLVIGQVTNRVFVGLPLCRNRELLDAGVAYAQAIPIAAQVLALLPGILRPLVAPLVTRPNRRHENTWFRLMLPEVEQRLREHETSSSTSTSTTTSTSIRETQTGDFLQWLVEHARATGDARMCEPKTLAARVLLINAAAVHTSSFAITHVLLDLVGCGRARGPGIVAELRREIGDVLAATGGRWDKRGLARMEKLDSTFRESQRLNTVLTVGPLRIVSAPGGVTTPSGVVVPRGHRVGIPAYSMHLDEHVWGADAAEFSPFRFSDKRRQRQSQASSRDQAGQLDQQGDYVRRARQAWATTSTSYLSFGAGKNSCPGRFFAAAELKVMLGMILLQYDLEFQEERPRNQWFGTNHLPPTNATIKIRRREDVL